MAVISSLSCISDHSDEKEIFPISPSLANWALVSPLGMVIVDTGDKGKHITSFVYVLQSLCFTFPDLATFRCGAGRAFPDLAIFCCGADGRGT